MQIILLIPAYKPTFRLVELINSINLEKNFRTIIINNGNNHSHNLIFEELEKKKYVKILKLTKNYGKGYGIKEGLKFCLKMKEVDKIIFADCDGQHTNNDILNIKNYFIKNNTKSFLIGKRLHNFQTPILNFLGNKSYKLIFNFFFNLKVHDPLSGLRGIDFDHIDKLIKIKSNGFEFEVETLTTMKKMKIDIINIPVSSTYFKDNKSNFLKISDSLIILKKTLRLKF